jgi:hypothetical protein
MVRNLHKGGTFVRCRDYVSIILRDFRRDATASCFALVLIVPKIREQGGGSRRKTDLGISDKRGRQRQVPTRPADVCPTRLW